MRSQKHPLPTLSPQYHPMDLGMPSELDENLNDAPDGLVEEYEEDSVIELCEVRLQFDHFTLSACYVSSHPNASYSFCL